MNRRLLPLLLLVLPALCVAGERVDQILARQRQAGYPSPVAAIHELQAADDRPGPAAPLELRRRYHAALAGYAVQMRRDDMSAIATDSLAQLDAMARSERCQPCLVEKLLTQAQGALSRSLPDEAHAYIARAESLVPADDPHLQLRLHLARGRLNFIQGDFTRAVTDLVPAIELAERQGRTADRVLAMASLMGSNAGLRDFERADAVAREAYAQAERMDFRYAMVLIRLNQSFMYLRSEQRDRQLAALDDVIRIAGDDPGLVELKAIGLSNLADYWLSAKDFHKALDYARRAAGLALGNDDRRSLSYALTNEGIAMAALGDVNAGVAKVREAAVLAERLGAKNDIVGIADELVKILQQAGRYREALEETQKVAALNRELTRQERERAAMELQEKYAADKRQREIERLTAANRIKQAEVEARTWQQRMWAIVAVSLLLATVPLVRWLRRTRLANRKLSGDIAVLAEQSMHDPLTGVFNRRYCQALMVQHAAAITQGTEAGVGLVLLDVDFFKKVNDAWGHAAGDRVLVEIARRLKSLLRQQDAVVRWGGEEFALLLPGTGAAGVATLAERMLQAVGATPVDIGGHDLPVTVSAGCVVFPLAGAVGWDETLQVADLALYLSKSGGRNRATCVSVLDASVDRGLLCSDLLAAQAGGHVALETIPGPASTEIPRHAGEGTRPPAAADALAEA